MSSDFYCDEVLSGRTPVQRVMETANVLAYHHTRPFYPVHIVVFPKRHVDSLLTLDDPRLLAEMVEVIQAVAAQVGGLNEAINNFVNTQFVARNFID